MLEELVTLFSGDHSGLSVSIGVTKRQDAQDSLDELTRSSDRRMYEDKRAYYQLHDRRK